MNLKRVRFSNEVSGKLSDLKGRTGLTPNILCRIAFCMSVEQSGRPDPEEFDPNSDREIDRHVLLGNWDPLFVALIKERCKQDGLETSDPEFLTIQFRAHVHRGVYLLHKRVKKFGDLIHLMPHEIRNDVLSST